MLTVTNKIYIRVTAFLFQKCVFVEINLEPEIEKILNLLFKFKWLIIQMSVAALK